MPKWWWLWLGGGCQGSGDDTGELCTATVQCPSGDVVCHATTKEVCDLELNGGCTITYREVACADGDCALDPDCATSN